MRALRIGFLLGFRQIQRANFWTTTLIIFVMMLTFLNLIAVSGILVGLIVGAEVAVREKSIGDIVVSARDDEERILETETFVRELSAFPEVTEYSVRYVANGVLEANYKERRDLTGERDIANVRITGINPMNEDGMTTLSEELIAGEYLDPNEEGYILVGALYIEEYAQQFGGLFDSLENVIPGSTVRLTAGKVSKEFIVKGIIQSKVDEISLNTYIPDREFRRLFNRFDRNADQIVIRVINPKENAEVKAAMIASGLADLAKIQTYEEGVPKFLTDIKNTFDLLGTFIGSIGLVVASITIFIIIFINALSRRQQIGILKGIGIDRAAIEIAYVLQAAFYALSGSLLGALVTYGFLIGYFQANPIDFPFSDGILVAEPIGTLYRFITLFIITLFAGFIPAWLIVRQNTLNSILGRK
jgi:ABC-type lipoprotein release transport system permease subunit